MTSTSSGSPGRSTCPTRRSCAPSCARAVEADANGIVVDLTECEFIDSSAIRALLLSREAEELRRRRREPRRGRLERPDPPHPRVMGLDQVLPIEPTVKQAAAALSG